MSPSGSDRLATRPQRPVWRHALAGMVVVGAVVGVMIASYQAGTPWLTGWAGRHLRALRTAVIVPLAPAPPEPAVPPVPAPPPELAAAEPLPAELLEVPEPPSLPARPGQPEVAAAPATAAAEAAATAGPRPVSPEHAERAPVAEPDSKTKSPVKRVAANTPMLHLRMAHQGMMAGDVLRARREMEIAEARLTSRPGNEKAADELGQSLVALTYGDQVSALRHLNSAMAATSE